VYVFGVSYGAVAVTGGLPLWVPAVLSVLVMAGSSELLFVGIVAAGGNPLAAALAGVLVNARHLPYGLALPADAIGKSRILGTHLMNDESVVFALAQSGQGKQHAAFWACAVGVFITWPAGAVTGALLGGVVHNTSAFGLDAVFPAMILALTLPALRESRRLSGAAIVGGAIALIGTACGLPAGLPVLLALAALVLAW
jgi:4-azaleucine resistance transporter AzlC